VSEEVAPPWWKEAVFYQVYPRSFQDSNRDGIGDLPGVTRRLDYLKNTLGVDVIWLSPFYRSPMRDMGYDVSDYCDVDPCFGTLDDFDELVRQAHQLGLRVVIDFVPNHTSSDHPWFRQSASSRNNPKSDWYVWRDGRGDGREPPNNWLSIFGGPSWAFHEGRGQFYLHSFLPEQPDLNWRNPEVVEAMFGVLSFWLDRGVDGFRIDVAHFILKDPELRDNPPNPSGRGIYHKPVGDYESQLHVHDLGHPDVHRVYAEMRRLTNGCDRAPVLLGEIHLQDDLDRWASYFGTPTDPELHLPFNFGLLSVPFEARLLAEHIRAIEGVTSVTGRWPTYVLGNHDEPRMPHRIGTRHLRAAATLLLTLRGSPTLYYGDEIGMPEVEVPEERRRDPWGSRVPGQNLGRDGCRAPMRWEDRPGAGFTDDGQQPWLPIGRDLSSVNVDRQLESPTSLLQVYRALLRLRAERPCLRLGRLEALVGEDEVLSYERVTPRERLAVEMNLGEEPRASRYAADAPTLLRLTDHAVDREPTDVPDMLAPGEARIGERQSS
jgi:glycosidase